QKIRLSLLGDAAARALAVRDPNKLVAMSAIRSPKITEREVMRFVFSREVCDDVLRFIANKRDWTRHYEVKRGLVTNPKTPIGVSMKWLVHLRDHDLRSLAKSRNVPSSIKTAAMQR